jgi:hypothetical protein
MHTLPSCGRLYVVAALVVASATACSNKPSEAPLPTSARLALPTGAPPEASTASRTASDLLSAPPPANAGVLEPLNAGSDASANADDAAAASIDWTNAAKYTLASDELTERARALFDAIVTLDPARAEGFWFPREPFIPLKDVKNPGRYWDTLHKAYLDDVRALHRKRKSWDGATFERFTVGSTPKWVKPGDEVNKIGYYRSFHGTIHYRIGDEPAKLDVHTLITWQGRWYVTHLRKIKKKS